MLPIFSLQSNDLTAGSTNVRVDIECLPQVINRSGSGHSSDIDKNANVGLKNRAKGVKKPTMRIDLFLVLLLQTEYNLHRDIATFGSLNVECRRIDGNWGAVA